MSRTCCSTSGLYDYAEDQAYQAFVLSHPRHRWTRSEQLRFAITHNFDTAIHELDAKVLPLVSRT